MQFVQGAKASGLVADVNEALGCAMQVLCADPEAHRLTEHPELWASDDEDLFQGALPNGEAWNWKQPLNPDAVSVRPAIIHLPRSKGIIANTADQPE